MEISTNLVYRLHLEMGPRRSNRGFTANFFVCDVDFLIPRFLCTLHQNDREASLVTMSTWPEQPRSHPPSFT